MDTFTLPQFIAYVGEDRAKEALSSFSVVRNPDVENFIRRNAFNYQKSHNARTYHNRRTFHISGLHRWSCPLIWETWISEDRKNWCSESDDNVHRIVRIKASTSQHWPNQLSEGVPGGTCFMIHPIHPFLWQPRTDRLPYTASDNPGRYRHWARISLLLSCIRTLFRRGSGNPCAWHWECACALFRRKLVHPWFLHRQTETQPIVSDINSLVRVWHPWSRE